MMEFYRSIVYSHEAREREAYAPGRNENRKSAALKVNFHVCAFLFSPDAAGIRQMAKCRPTRGEEGASLFLIFVSAAHILPDGIVISAKGVQG